MKLDVLMFVALAVTMAAAGVNNLRGAVADDPTFVVSQTPPMQISSGPIERIAVLENNYKHMMTSFADLRTELRRETGEIKAILKEQNDEIDGYLFWFLGVLLAGDLGLGIRKKLKEVKVK